jgi:hypothetical protein
VITLTRRAAVQVAMLVGITTAAVLAAAPTVAWLNYKRGIENERSYFQIVGQEMTRVWRAAMGQPLTIVTGEFSLAEAASFYSPDHPDFIEWFGSPSEPWVTAERLRREGWAAVCLAGDATCISGFEAHGGSTRVDRTLSVSFFGFSGAAKEFVFILAPPAAGAPLPAGSR